MPRAPQTCVPAIRTFAFLVLLVSATAARAQAQSADLSITKADSPDPVVAGTNVTYTITIANAGPSAAALVTMSDVIPPGTTFVSMLQNSGPAFTLTTPPVGGTGGIIGGTASLASGASATFTLVLNVSSAASSGTTIVNTASVVSNTPDPTSANNSDTENTSVVAGSDLAVTKSDTPDPVTAGSNVIYTITVTNAGPTDGLSVTLIDPIPAGTTFVSLLQNLGPAFTLTTPPVGGTGTIAATIGGFSAGATATFILVVNVNSGTANGTILTNTATVSSGSSDPNAANNSDTETTTVQSGISAADLSLTKSDLPDPAAAGSNISYTMTVTNAGPSAAASVSLTDTLPANTTFVSLVQNSGPAFTVTTPPVGGTGAVTATVASLAAGATAT